MVGNEACAWGAGHVVEPKDDEGERHATRGELVMHVAGAGLCTSGEATMHERLLGQGELLFVPP